MMKKIRNWLIDRFLPMWAKETVLAENRDLHRKVLQLKHRSEVLEAYVKGLTVGMRSRQRVVINSKEVTDR